MTFQIIKQKAGPKLSTAAVYLKFLANLIPKTTIPAKAYSPPANSSPCNLMYLPGEIIDFILRKLEPRDLLHLTHVNQTLRYISLLRLETWFDMRLPARERLLRSHTPELSPIECVPSIEPGNDSGEVQAQAEFDLYVKLSLREFNQFQSRRNAAVSADCMVASAMVTAGNLLARLWRPDYSNLKRSNRFRKTRGHALNLKSSGMNTANNTNSVRSSYINNSSNNSNSSGRSTPSVNDEIIRRAEFIVYWIAREVFVTGEMSAETAILVLEFLDEQYPIWGAIHASHFSKLAESDMSSGVPTDLLFPDSFLFSDFFFRITQQVTEALLINPSKTDVSTTATTTATTTTATSLFKTLQVPLPVAKEFKSVMHQVQCMMVWPLRSCQIEQFDCSQIQLFLPNDYCKYSNPHPAGFDSVLFDILQSGFLKASLTNFFFTRYDRASSEITKHSEPTTGEHTPVLRTESTTSVKDLLEIPESREISTCLGRYWDLRQESDRILDAIIKGPEVNNAQMLSPMGVFTGVLSFTGKNSRITRPRKRVRCM